MVNNLQLHLYVCFLETPIQPLTSPIRDPTSYGCSSWKSNHSLIYSALRKENLGISVLKLVMISQETSSESIKKMAILKKYGQEK